MPRLPTWGTPGRTQHYQRLRPKYVLLGVGVLLGFLTFSLLGFFQAVGLRSPLSPGSVTSSHSGIDTRCEACHAGREASDLRCQRCHDGGGGGSLTLGAHVFFGSGDMKKADKSGAMACARCHVEHRGRSAKLSHVNEGHCLECHAPRNPAAAGQTFRISSLSGHPEFQVLRESLQADPKLLFSHKQHMKEVVKEGAAGEWETCVRCHVPAGRDLQRIDYEPHCARCHSESELTMEPVPTQDVQVDVPLPGAVGALNKSPDGATVQRVGIRHRDEWILFNLRKLQSQLYPQAYARDRDALLSRASQLERRLYQAQPLSGLTLQALREREAATAVELQRLSSRERSLGGKSGPQAGLDRMAEINVAAAVAGEGGAAAQAAAASKEAEALRQAALPKPEAMPAEEFELRRQELLSLLEALGSADPGRSRTVDDLRRRLLALTRGETAEAIVQRAIAQRQRDLERIRDEIALREADVAVEARSLPDQLALQRELKGVRDTIAKFYSFAGGAPALGQAERTRKLDTLLKLTGAGSVAAGKGERCAKCHVLNEGSLLPQRAARSVMVRATFAHQSHQDAPLPGPTLLTRVKRLLSREPAAGPARSRCAYCHAAIPTAGDAPRKPSIPGVQSCRECHRGGATRYDCQLCHRYHPPGVAS